MQEDKNAILQMRFPQKLWHLLNLRSDAILWGGTGRTILLNYRVLHNYLQCDNSIFKTANISSFVRQLNLYGFRKVTSHLQDPLCNSSNPYMHEYVHDYFQYGRPELLNNITRKALAMKKHNKPKCIFSNNDPLFIITPLQKARRALRMALKKAAQDMFMQSAPKKNTFKLIIDCEGIRQIPSDNYREEPDENIELDWFINRNTDNSHMSTKTENDDCNPLQTQPLNVEDEENYGNTSQEAIISFNDETCQQSNNNFPTQFLSMPELDADTSDTNTGVLLTEFNIDHNCNINDNNEETGKHSLDCVLPSVSNEQTDQEVSIAIRNLEDSGHYHGEWEQMFNDIIANRGSVQECGSELKELYSQISRTIDLLNS